MDLLGRRWDPRWYTDIAEFGYDDPEGLGPTLRVACPDATPAGCLPGAPDRHSNLAFFPLLPAILRVLATAGMDPAVAAVIVAGVAPVVAAAIIGLIGRDVAGDRVGVAISMRRMPIWLLAATLTMLAVLSVTFQIHLWESSIDF
jgi:hypothetical protein